MGSQTEIEISCRDGTVLRGHLWETEASNPIGTVVINPATGVLARYYHYYARFLCEHGFDALTFDYRGIGLSRPASLRGFSASWRDWGEQDLEAVLTLARSREPDKPLHVVGHSIGGFLPGFSASALKIERMLTVGAQFAWRGDYGAGSRLLFHVKWHMIMPLLTSVCGYFPGRRLGWLEDLPAGVAREWATRRPKMELSYAPSDRSTILESFATVPASILAVSLADDPLATPAAVGRALSLFLAANRTHVHLAPRDFDMQSIGHFGLFHARHASGFWLDTVLWLRDGINPWPGRVVGR